MKQPTNDPVAPPPPSDRPVLRYVPLSIETTQQKRENDTVTVCLYEKEDYFECLHHKKEYQRVKEITQQHEKNQKAAKAGGSDHWS